MVFDLFGLTDDEVRRRFPEAYQHLLETVKVARQRVFERSPTRDAKEYLDRWWLFGKPQPSGRAGHQRRPSRGPYLENQTADWTRLRRHVVALRPGRGAVRGERCLGVAMRSVDLMNFAGKAVQVDKPLAHDAQNTGNFRRRMCLLGPVGAHATGLPRYLTDDGCGMTRWPPTGNRG